MKKCLLLAIAGMLLVGCSDSEKAVEEKVKESVSVKAESPEKEKMAPLTEGEYYLHHTHPAIVDIWDEFDAIFEDISATAFEGEYDREYLYTCMTALMSEYRDLNETIDELPMDKLEGNTEHLEKFKENAKLANDRRWAYGQAIISGLTDTGIRKSDFDRAQGILEMSNRASAESMEDVNRYEEEKGF